jgi:hypothetical protein
MKLLSMVHMFCHQRAASAALSLQVAQHGRTDVRLVWRARCRRRDRSPGMQDPVKTEGKIKGSARRRPLSQSARGVGKARWLVACVPSRCVKPLGIRFGRVPPSVWVACLRWSVCHGYP